MIMNKIKAIIFDLDGTVVDSEPNYYESDRKLFAEYGISVSLEMKNKYVGIGSKEMMEDMKKIYDINDSVEDLVNKKNKYYIEIAKDNTVVFPEMLKFLKKLKDNNYPMAIASGSSPEVIDLILSVTNIRHYFDVVLSAEQVKKGKPAPDVFLAAAKQLGMPAENCVVLEDSQYGVEAAKSAGMHCIALPYLTAEPLHESFNMADMLFKKGISEFTAEKAYEWLIIKG